MSEIRNENDPELIMMGYVIRDEDTDEIIGIRDDAPRRREGVLQGVHESERRRACCQIGGP